ncbi:hypothetical protein [uncultured Selenomonas sp.]|uniref:hypothetical protein n=1 Tax=uncultured Selenomonas sp. TaxID=159275 RepID=UPI0028D4E094|nr:hypothetical protein [uncultured Selenomonas sp.]
MLTALQGAAGGLCLRENLRQKSQSNVFSGKFSEQKDFPLCASNKEALNFFLEEMLNVSALPQRNH